MTTLTNSPGPGLVTLDSGVNTILQSGLLTGPGGLAKAGAGQLNLTAANDYTGETRVEVGTLALQGGGTVQGSVTNLGMVDPGQLVGTLTVTGDYDQSAGGTLNAQLGALGHDVLAVGGAATLGGTLNVTTLIFTPSSGNIFTVLTATALSGSFAATNLPALSGGATWSVTYPGGAAVVLSVVGGVAPTPYESWATSFGLSGTNAYNEADPDGDGYANLLEYSQGSNPTSGLSNVKLWATLTNGAARLLIQRVNSATDIVYHVEGACQIVNGASWSVISSNVLGTWDPPATVDDNNTGAVHEVRIVDTVSAATNRFLRLRVSRP